MDDIKAKMQEAHELICEFIAVEFTPRRELEIIRRLDEICPDPNWTTRVFQDPDTKGENDEETAKLAVKKIFDYKPIQLTDRSNEVLD